MLSVYLHEGDNVVLTDLPEGTFDVQVTVGQGRTFLPRDYVVAPIRAGHMRVRSCCSSGVRKAVESPVCAVRGMEHRSESCRRAVRESTTHAASTHTAHLVPLRRLCRVRFCLETYAACYSSSAMFWSVLLLA